MCRKNKKIRISRSKKYVRTCGKHIFKTTKVQPFHLLKRVDGSKSRLKIQAQEPLSICSLSICKRQIIFKKHRKWNSDKAKDNYIDEDLKLKLPISKKLGLEELFLSLLLVSQHVVVHYDFEKVTLSILNLPLCSFNGCF